MGTVDFLTLLNNVLVLREAELSYEEQLSGSIITGAQVKRGQILFTLCSPDLVATQQEYLLAVKGKRTLGGSPFPEAAGAFATFLVTLFADEPET